MRIVDRCFDKIRRALAWRRRPRRPTKSSDELPAPRLDPPGYRGPGHMGTGGPTKLGGSLLPADTEYAPSARVIEGPGTLASSATRDSECSPLICRCLQMGLSILEAVIVPCAGSGPAPPGSRHNATTLI